MCYRCHERGHLANGCPNKEKPQPKPRVKQGKSPQPQIKINHDDQVDDLKMMKKRTRRGGKVRARHPTHIQDVEQEQDSREESTCSHQVP